MGKSFKVLVLSVVAILPQAVWAGLDLTDFILESYALTPAQEEQFSHTDGAVSAFWAEWENRGTLDYIIENPFTNGRSNSLLGFEGEEDCMLKVKAAYGDKGLYLLLETTDDQFVDAGAEVPDSEALSQPGLNPEWMNDAIDMYIDRYSSTEQKDGRYITTYDQRTATYVQIQYRFGGDRGPSTVVRVNRLDPAWTGAGDPIKYSHLSVNEAYALGLLFEVVLTEAGKKSQEWLIQWSQVGSGLSGRPEMGKQIAFIVGYNDIDAGEKSPDILRWKNLGDAYSAADNWGDIQFMPSIEEAASAPVIPRAAISGHRAAATPAPSAQTYTIDGRRVGAALVDGIVVRQLTRGTGPVAVRAVIHR